MKVVAGKPYNDNFDGNKIIREFSEKINPSELVWHRDYKDRKVKVLEGSGWKIQYDNCLPVELKEGDEFKIMSMDYHRILKGTTKLVIEIEEC